MKKFTLLLIPLLALFMSVMGADKTIQVKSNIDGSMFNVVYHDNGDGTYSQTVYSSGGTFSITLPAANLGQRAMAASLSVVPASDIADATYIGDVKFGEALPAGTNSIGTVVPLGSLTLDDTVTIADGESLSDAEDLGGKVLCGIIIPSTWQTATSITFQASNNGTDYFNLYDSSGSEVTYTVAASYYLKFSPSTWAGVKYLKVRSGTAASAVAQAGGDVITLISRSM